MQRMLAFTWLVFGIMGFAAAEQRPPNIVLIYCDDMGYGDLGCYGSTTNLTPNLDRLAAEGMRFTDFHTAAAVCSASRAALLTGCYPQRVGIMGALGPKDRHGIHADEQLLPEILQARGFATAIYGKWHLGHHAPFLPQQHGFDEYFGLPYSNDMWPFHPSGLRAFPDLPLIDGDRIVTHNPDQNRLTQWYTDRAVKFIEQNKEKPFFVYLPHSMPHVPLYVNYEHYGRTGRGIYADVLFDIDAGVGRILAELEKHQLTEQTLVIFSSDNGPWLTYGSHAGSSGGFREGKGTTFEGGMRVPCIARWPGKIPAGSTCNELCGTIDIMPTCAAIAEAPRDTSRVIDGRDLRPLLMGEKNAQSPHEAYLYYWIYGLDAIRSGPWKLHFPHLYPSLTGKPGENGKPAGITQQRQRLALYNLSDDPAESRDVAAEHPEIVAKLEKLADLARADLGDSHRGMVGANRRPAGKLPDDEPAGSKPTEPTKQ
jgi:arylsulfatase A-like enzyme